MTADRTMRTIALLILMAAATAMCLEIAWLARGLRIDLIPQAQAVVAKASTTLDDGNAAIKVQQGYWDAELRETRKATADLHDLIIHTDLSLNGRKGVFAQVNDNLIPGMVSVLGSTDRAVSGFSADGSRLLRDSDSSVAGLRPLEAALTARVADPRYDAMLDNANDSMKNLTAATGSAAHSLATADEVVTQEAKIILAPVSKIKAAIMIGLQGAGRFFGF